MSHLPNPLDHRTADFPIEELFLRRWSPRAMSGLPLGDAELNTLFEAARWAPSTYNEQEWRFLYARRDTQHWEMFLHLLMEANQAWCKNAAVLVVVVSHKVFERNGKPNPVHKFDSGAAFENLCLQAATMGLVAHGMAGFDRERARAELGVPDDYDVEAMIALGHPGNPDDLPEGLLEREVPSGRKPIHEIICEGPFAF
jgi:nitroreductase